MNLTITSNFDLSTGCTWLSIPANSKCQGSISMEHTIHSEGSQLMKHSWNKRFQLETRSSLRYYIMLSTEVCLILDRSGRWEGLEAKHWTIQICSNQWLLRLKLRSSHWLIFVNLATGTLAPIAIADDLLNAPKFAEYAYQQFKNSRLEKDQSDAVDY
jgi:hypothetical protein